MAKINMKECFDQALVDLGKKYPELVVIDSDSRKVLGTGLFAKEFPERAFNVGIQEANLVGVAAGMANMGKMPLVSAFTSFMARRAYDQTTISLAYSHLPAILVGINPGVASELNGGTHMCFQDVAIMRAMPGCEVVEPSDATQLTGVLEDAIKNRKLVYLRLFRGEMENIHGEGYQYEAGKGSVLREGSDVTVIASGMTAAWALEAADLLEKEGIRAEIVDIGSVKPIDRELVIAEAKKTGKLVTIDNGNVLGGIGGAVAEVVCDEFPVPVKRLGAQDRFGEVGKLPYLKKVFGLDPESICASVKEFVKG